MWLWLWLWLCVAVVLLLCCCCVVVVLLCVVCLLWVCCVFFVCCVGVVVCCVLWSVAILQRDSWSLLPFTRACFEINSRHVDIRSTARDHRKKNTKKKKNNETSSSTCGQQCTMKCQEHNRSKKGTLRGKKESKYLFSSTNYPAGN